MILATEIIDYEKELQERKKKRHKKSTGRRSNDAKRDMIEKEHAIYRDGVAHDKQVFHREQFAWRFMDGKAVYVCYKIYDLPDSKQSPLPQGLRTSRSEFGIEIILTLAFLHYWIGVSIDNVCQIMRFFTGLELPKSQADSLLNQLSTDWNKQYDAIAQLFALSMLVYIDETGWKIGKHSCYTWTFSTTMHVLFRCGVGHPKVDPTNNRSERNVRREAEIRKGGRTSKTTAGAKRRSVTMTVLASLQTRFEKFTLDNLLSEVQRWLVHGRSVFELELVQLQKANASPVYQPAFLPNN